MDTNNTEEALRVLDRILDSESFKSSPALQNILKYVVNEELEGRGEQLKAFSIGIDAMGRPHSFDPQTDPVVRVNFGRLRSALASYYANEGRSDEIILTVPKGAYRPKFVSAEKLIQSSGSFAEKSARLRSKNIWIPIAIACLVLALLAYLLVVQPSLNRDGIIGDGFDASTITVEIREVERINQPETEKEEARNVTRALRRALSRNEALSIIFADAEPLTGSASRKRDFIISSYVQRIGEKKQVSIELVNGHTRTVVWARTQELENAAVQPDDSSIVDAFVRELNTQIFGASIKALEGRDPSTLSAQQLFVLATWVPGPAKNSLAWEKQRVQLARMALEKDPEYGPAYSVIADKLAYLSSVDGPSNTEENVEEAGRSAQRALELSPGDANVMFNVAQYNWHTGHLRMAIRSMRRVLELDPNHALAGFFLIVIPYTCSPAPEDVLEAAIKFDQSLGPDNPIRWVTLTWLGWLHLNRGELELALDAEERAAQIFQIPYTVMRRATVLNELGRTNEAAQLVRGQLANWPNIDPEHFSQFTMPRLCSQYPHEKKMIGFYENLARSTKGLIRN